MTKNKKILQVVIHLAVWTGFLTLPFVSFSGSRGTFTPDIRFQLLFFFTNLFLIGFYYLHSMVLIPKLLAQKKVGLYVCSIIILLAFFLFLPNIYFSFVDFPVSRFTAAASANKPPIRFPIKRKFWFFPFTPTIVLFLLIIVISGGIKVINQWFKMERRNEEIEREKATTELALLKSQINPHFFFNTLNNIYSLAVTNSPDTAATIMKLSSIMRYVLDDAKSNYTPLNKEIQFVENFIALQSARLTDKTIVHFTKEGDIENKQIAPLLLIPFVENAFKYGISAHQPSVIDIAVKATNGHLNFVVTNQKFLNNPDLTNTGIGLKNTKRRLELLYPNRHSLQIENRENSFHVHLILDLA